MVEKIKEYVYNSIWKEIYAKQKKICIMQKTKAVKDIREAYE